MDRSTELALLAALAEAAKGSHNENLLAKRVDEVLAAHCVVELILPGRQAKRAGSGRVQGARTIGLEGGGELRLSFAGRRPWDDAMFKAVAAVLQAAFGHARTLARVAKLSRQAHADREALREELDHRTRPAGLVAESPAMRRIVQDVLPNVARADATVLLRGETGTGKEVLARYLHTLSPRSRHPLLAVNCGALPETLAESTLFGHERGAFTGAHARHPGIFERARGGTVLLDEVGELSPAMQARLLRVLEDRAVERLGGTAVVKVDVRVIAATHRPLEAMIAEGRFREDLFYRLNVVPIQVPPLRDRTDDLGPLAHCLLEDAAERMGRPVPEVTSDAIARLRAWRWPGNVRELRNVIERALVLTEGNVLELPTDWDPSSPDPTKTILTPARFDEAQRALLRDALDACGGRIYGPDGAAARLGLAPTTLQSKLARLGISGRRR